MKWTWLRTKPHFQDYTYPINRHSGAEKLTIKPIVHIPLEIDTPTNCGDEGSCGVVRPVITLYPSEGMLIEGRGGRVNLWER